ncbi:MAG TPA: L,D-transpeptidase, partial [Polyangiaceae bacterium]|nr:L,D-transpeptidase [Polyangiaceae bacterium]
MVASRVAFAAAPPPPAPAVTPPPGNAEPTTLAPDAGAPGEQAVFELMATAKQTRIYSAPDSKSAKLGYLRGGAVVRRSSEPAGFVGCKSGWYGVEPRGFVCVGEEASLDVNDALAEATALRADRTRPLPYEYGRSRNPAPFFYTRIPTPDEQRQTEPDFAQHTRYQQTTDWTELGLAPVPQFLSAGQSSLHYSGRRQNPLVLSAGQAVAKSGFALLSLFDAGGRAFGLTTDLSVVALDRLERIAPSRFHGLPLSGGATLPVVFSRSKGALLYQGDPKTGFQIVRPLGDREGLAVNGRVEKVAGHEYLQTASGEWISAHNALRVEPLAQAPNWAKEGQLWIDISLKDQTLVAYEGSTPVFVTLVSTGADGMGDPKTTHSTVQGLFRIHTKHVSVTMDGDEVGDEFDLRDVPYVQYFYEGYALHGAYWH